jgi:hypothetical protein
VDHGTFVCESKDCRRTWYDASAAETALKATGGAAFDYVDRVLTTAETPHLAFLEELENALRRSKL